MRKEIVPDRRMFNVINKKLLKSAGWKKFEHKHFGREGKSFIYQIPGDHRKFVFVMGEYPQSNPNCGSLFIYSPGHKSTYINRKGKKEKLETSPVMLNIASYIYFIEHLNNIIKTLTKTM